MHNNELLQILTKLKDSLETAFTDTELVLNIKPNDPNGFAIKKIQNVVAEMRPNLSITEANNASFFFDLEDL